MELEGRHVVITGAAGGIGRAFARRFLQEAPSALTLADRDFEGARAIADEVGGLAVELDAGSEASVLALVETATEANGPIDIFISNAGVPGALGGPEAPDELWDEAWRVNVMAHVWASRALLPEMVARGEGYLINTASAAGLLTQVSSLVYSVTKHAAVALAEWLSIEYAEQGVRTPMLDLAMTDAAGAAALVSGGLIEPEDAADAVVEGIRAERTLILTHENVAGFMALKATDPERWLRGMRRIVRDARAAETPGAEPASSSEPAA